MAARTAVGLDIGTSGVRAAEVTVGKAGRRLERFGQVALPEGAVLDGEVIDVGLVSAAIKQLWAQAKFSTKRVVLGVANQKVVVRQVELPWLAPNELRKSLPFQVQDFIPMPVDQAILDCHLLEEFTSDSGARMVRVLLVAAGRDMVDSAVSAVNRAGLEPVMVDLTSFAILRSQIAGGSALPSVEAEAVIDIGASVTNIVVHQGGVPRFVRILLMGGADITTSVAERMGVPQEQAESIKQSAGLALTPGAADPHPANRSIESAGSAFIEEVRGSLDYYLSQPGAARISRVLLSGGGSRLLGLSERLSAATRLPVETVRAMSTMTIGKTGLTDAQLDYVEPMVTVPVGLAMGMAS